MRSIRFPSQGFMGIWGVVWLLPLMKGSLNPKSLCSASICSSDLRHFPEESGPQSFFLSDN